jgi:hypothetical protein
MEIFLKSDYLKEFTSGLIGGITSTFIGHPMDTIKVKKFKI